MQPYCLKQRRFANIVLASEEVYTCQRLDLKISKAAEVLDGE
jgi:hypothetical protein